MCKNPVSVPNPLFRRRGYFSEHGKIYEVPKELCPGTEFIQVPCGKCPECRDTYFNSLLQRAMCESMSSYMYFVTLTYDDEHIPFMDLDDERILYANYSHVQNMFKRFRAAHLLDRDFRYLVVNEYGDNYSRPHFHIIIFVAKKQADDDMVKYRIERLLFDNLKKFYAVNVGTRKHPIYEKLFTYNERVTPFGIKSNYWVKLVENDLTPSHLLSDDDSAQVRTIRYLIGYVNTDIRIDKSISDFLHRHSHDPILCDRVKRILSNKVRFSKGFGCGFVDGEKFYLPKISCRASANILTYSEIVDSLPPNVGDFIAMFPDLYDSVLAWIHLDKYRSFDSLKSCVNSFTVEDMFLHCLTVRYFPKHFSNHIHNLYKDDFIPSISSYFDMFRPYSFTYKRVTTQAPSESSLYKFLRTGVEAGIKSGVPFIAYPLMSQQKYIALCKYYRDRVCTIADYKRMYLACGVRNYDEWVSRFIQSYNTNKADKSVGNKLKYKENSEIVLQNQKKSLHLFRKASPNLYHLLFVH